MTGRVFGIRAAQLFDGATQVIEDPLVVVEGDRIRSVAAGVGTPLDFDVVDLGGATLLPGLIDSHVHLCFDATADPVGGLAAADDRDVMDRIRKAAAIALHAGITLVRDLGDARYLTLRAREEFARRPHTGPDVLAAGPPITTVGGHCWYLGGATNGVEEIRAAVAERARRGVDVVKVMATGGDLTPGSRSWAAQFGVDELAVAMLEARQLGLPVTAHAHGAAGIINAVNAGIGMIEHCSFITSDGTQAADADVIRMLVERGVIVSLTVGLAPGAPQSAATTSVLARRHSGLVDLIQRLRQAGATVVCGTDAGVGPAKPHDVLPYAISALVGIGGFEPVNALRSAMSTSAAALGVGQRKGRLAAGFDADILATTGSPLANIDALRSVEAVFHRGSRVR